MQRPTWRDSRLLVGVVLVLLATALGAKAVASADDRVPMYAASVALKPGDRLGADNLQPVDVQLGDGSGAYVSAATSIAPDSYALREVRQGELLPVSAVGAKSALAVQPVTVRVDASSTGALVAGSVVDVWVSDRDPATTQERYLEPALALRGVSVAWIPTDQTRFGVSTTMTAVQLLVPREEIQKLLAAQDKQSRVTLVPVPGSTRGSG
ncbi:MAG: hypothetical protein ACOYBY_02325 [Dermatophilaceae bacterium]